MTLAERNISKRIDRFPWESPLGEVSVNQEEISEEQTSYQTGTLFDCMLGSMSHTPCIRVDELESFLRLLRVRHLAFDVVNDFQQVAYHGLWERENKAPAMARLEDAASTGEKREFLEALNEIEWQDRTPEDFLRAIQLAFKVGAHLAARQLSVEGTKHYPADPEIRKYARVLAPPKVVSRKVPPDPTRRANREWLTAHSGDYKGQWVAIRNGKLLGAAKSLRDLIERIGNKEDVLLTRA
jgi:hypothetical protein